MIDYVVPMVFADDPEWQADLQRVCPGEYAAGARFRSWGTEQLLIACVRKFMPWVRDIIVLLARESQVQPWMKELRVVFHRDFIPAEFLPTFNSRAIEMFLHRIPGLSEHFLYGNDDMIPVSPLQKEDFFRNNLPCQRMTWKAFPEHPNNFQAACMGGLNFVGEEFGLKFTTTWLKNGHSIAPICRKSIEHLWQRDARRILASVSPLREVKNFNQYIYSWYQHFSGQYVEHTPARCLCNVKTHTPEQMAAELLNPDNQIVCINDNFICSDVSDYAAACQKAIKQRLEI